jgi:hypothetical protein
VDPHHAAALFIDGDQERRRQAGFAPEPLQLRRQAKKTGGIGEVVAEDQHRADLLVEDEVAQPLRDAGAAKARRHHLTDGHVERQGRRSIVGLKDGWWNGTR